MYQMEFRPSMVLFVLPKKKTVPGVSKGVRSMEVGGVPITHSLDGTSHTTRSCDPWYKWVYVYIGLFCSFGLTFCVFFSKKIRMCCEAHSATEAFPPFSYPSEDVGTPFFCTFA